MSTITSNHTTSMFPFAVEIGVFNATRFRLPLDITRVINQQNIVADKNESGVSDALQSSVATRTRRLLSRIDEFAEYADNWDSYGAKPITDAAHSAAITFLSAHPFVDQWKRPDLLEVLPVPTGGIQFEWTTPKNGIEVEFEINPQGGVHLLICKDDDCSEPDRNLPMSVEGALAYLLRSDVI